MSWAGRIVMTLFGYLAVGGWGAALGFIAGY
jgi:hypothetical protein